MRVCVFAAAMGTECVTVRARYSALGRLVTGSGAAVAVRPATAHSLMLSRASVADACATHAVLLTWQVKKLVVDQFLFAPVFLAVIVAT